MSLSDSSKDFKRDPRDNLTALMQGSAGGKSFYITPIFSPDIKEQNSWECVPSAENIKKKS